MMPDIICYNINIMFFVIQSLYTDTIYDTFVSEAFWNHSDIDFILCTAKKIAFQIKKIRYQYQYSKLADLNLFFNMWKFWIKTRTYPPFSNDSLQFYRDFKI